MRAVIVIALAVTGLAFSLSAAVGILRMPDVYGRIQCSSKTITMGALPALIALVVGEGPISSYGARALLVAVLLLVLSPAAAHSLARAAYKAGVPMWRGAVIDEVRQQVLRRQAARRGQGGSGGSGGPGGGGPAGGPRSGGPGGGGPADGGPGGRAAP